MSVPSDFALLLDELREEVAQAGNDNKKILDSLKVLHNLAGDCVIEATHLCELQCVTKCIGATGRQIYEVSGPNKGYSTVYKLYPRINYCMCSIFQKKGNCHKTTATDGELMRLSVRCLAASMRVLCVAEKNDAAKGIAQILSRGQSTRREGRSKYNKIYSFRTEMWNRPVTMAVTSVSGHLMNFNFPGNFGSWQAVAPSTLFDAPVLHTVTNDMMPIKQTLVEEARSSDVLIIWTDCDREGENIGFEVIAVCTEVKPNLDVYRAKFSEITPAAIGRAMAHLERPDKRISDAVDCRSELDLRIGAAFTRLQTLHLQRQFQQLSAGGVISYGSCQFPTLGFVVERYKAVQEFVVEPFWKLVVSHTRDGIKTDFAWRRVRLFAREPVEALLSVCRERPTARVVSVTQKPKSRLRPLAMDTIQLEKLAVRKLRMSAKDTMNIAERLYSQGYISYPRTETNAFPDNFNLPHLVSLQEADPNWGQFASDVRTRGVNPRNGNKSDQAHPPIHPIKYATPDQLVGNERRVYELVVRHFLACCSWDAIGQETMVDLDVAGEEFYASGLVITDRGYLDVYPYERWEVRLIPGYQTGETLAPDSIEVVQGQTSPPELLNEADLIALMDKHGIGTDATHAEHIETIKTRQYVGKRNDDRFVPGFLGLGLVDGYDRMGHEMSKPNLRSRLETDLKLICQGRRTKDEVLLEQIQLYRRIFEESERSIDALTQALNPYFGGGGPAAPGNGPFPPAGNGGPRTGGGNDDDDDEYPPNPPPPAVPSTTGVTKCPNCSRLLELRKLRSSGSEANGNGGVDFFLGCPGYDKNQADSCRGAIWLPKNTLDAVSVTDDTCRKCNSGKKLHLKFSRGKRPSDIRTNSYNGCIACDPKLIAWRTEGSMAPSTGDRAAPMCKCPVPRAAVQRQTKKEGQNKGRWFYSCCEPRENSCGFFEWITDAVDHGPVALPAGEPAENADSGICHCGTKAVLRTKKADGKPYWSCPKPFGDSNRCNFFSWCQHVIAVWLAEAMGGVAERSVPDRAIQIGLRDLSRYVAEFH